MHRWRIPGALVLTGLVTAAAAIGADAAVPSPGRFSGHQGGTTVNGFAAPVSFTVNSARTRLTAFTYGSLGCQGFGGLGPNQNPYAFASSVIKVGTISVSRDGRFSVRGARDRFVTGGVRTVIITTSAVSGRFTGSRRAVGTITFTQRFLPSAGSPYSCTGDPKHFTATRR